MILLFKPDLVTWLGETGNRIITPFQQLLTFGSMEELNVYILMEQKALLIVR